MDVEKIRKAGQVVGQVRDEATAKIVEGAFFMDILDFCEMRIKELGCGVAWAQISPTTTAAHFSPTSQDNPVCQPGDLIKLDLGAHVNGYIGDTACSVLIPSGDEEDMSLKKDLMKASRNALAAAGKIIDEGVRLRELGAAQFSEAESMGFTTIKNLCGHTIDQYKLHSGISIPTFDNGDTTEIKKGWLCAIEPFVTDGEGFIHDVGRSTIFMQELNKNTRSRQGRDVLTKIQSRNGLPFATRDLEKELGRATAVLGIRDLERQHILKGYPPLVEVSNRPVAQFEHSFYIGDTVENITK